MAQKWTHHNNVLIKLVIEIDKGQSVFFLNFDICLATCQNHLLELINTLYRGKIFYIGRN